MKHFQNLTLGIMSTVLLILFISILLILDISFASFTFSLHDKNHLFDAFSEGFSVLLILVWLLLIIRIADNPKIFVPLYLGMLLVLIGSIQDFMDEFYDLPLILDRVEKFGLPVGLLIGSFGIFAWVKDKKKMVQEAREREERFKQISIVDHLTGLYNARHLYTVLQSELERVKRYNDNFSLLLLDVDDFKVLNDTYGHLCGDDVLRGLGALISSLSRKSDSAFRYGGEEFVILLPETDRIGAFRAAERLREGFARLEFQFGDACIHKSISIGVSTYLSGDDADSILARVDAAMYRAKREGKNRTCYPPEEG